MHRQAPRWAERQKCAEGLLPSETAKMWRGCDHAGPHGRVWHGNLYKEFAVCRTIYRIRDCGIGLTFTPGLELIEIRSYDNTYDVAYDS